MSAQLRPCPKFTNPPVIETVLGVQFSELTGFSVVDFGLYWAKLRETFPDFVAIQEQGRLTPHFETFPKLPAQRDALQIMRGGSAERLWYVSSNDSEVVQLQPDRLMFNWRLRDLPYGSYAQSRTRFITLFSLLSEHCASRGIERPEVQLCESTYVNHIFPVPGENAVSLFTKIFMGINWLSSDDFLPQPELAVLNRAFLLPDRRGRLYAEASIGRVLPQNQEFISFNMTCRTIPKSLNNQELAEALDLAHEWVVRGFASITAKSVQEERWGRIQ